MKKVLILLLLLSLEIKAESNKFILKSSIQNGLKKVEVDVNQDKKVDRIETYDGETLVSIELDSKYSGKFDEWTQYFKYVSADKPVEITKKDTNGDGKIDRIETVYKDFKHDFLIVKTEVDSEFSGKFDKIFTNHTKLNQKKDEAPCLGNMRMEDMKILKLTNDINSVKMNLANGFYVTDWGYKIHQSCLEKWGANTFPALLKSAMSTGFQCLANLARENTKNKRTPNGALNNLSGLEYLTSKNSISIVCNEQSYNWSGTAAHASVAPGEVIKESGVQHPFISVNQNDPASKARPTAEEKSELSMTLFHEQLHNLGIRHNDSVEFPYACETCCLKGSKKEFKEGEKENACKICSGAYTGVSDKNYLNDLIEWGKTSYMMERSAKAIVKFEKEFPKDRWALFAYADSTADIFSPVGIQIAKILKSRFKDLTPEESAHLKNVENYESVDTLTRPEVAGFAKMAAEAHIGRYYEGDTKKVMDNLIRNKEMIKSLVKKQSEATDNDKYILDDIKKKINDLISDVWLQDYPNKGNADSDRAYGLLKETGLLK